MAHEVFLSFDTPMSSSDGRFHDTFDVNATRNAIKNIAVVVPKDAVLVVAATHPALVSMLRWVAGRTRATSAHRIVIYFGNDDPDRPDVAKEEHVDFRAVPVAAGENDAEAIRRAIMSGHSFDAGFFVGGMNEASKDYAALAESHPEALRFPVASTGGAALELWSEHHEDRLDLRDDVLYMRLFSNLMDEACGRTQRWPGAAA